MMKCFIEIEKQYGKHARRRFEQLLENNYVDRELTDHEIQEFKELFEVELCRIVFTRAGK